MAYNIPAFFRASLGGGFSARIVRLKNGALGMVDIEQRRGTRGYIPTLYIVDDAGNIGPTREGQPFTHRNNKKLAAVFNAMIESEGY